MNNATNQFSAADDPLGRALHQLRLHGTLYCGSQLSGDWSVAMPVLEDKMMFHIITVGQCWIQLDGEDPQLLKQGALVLIPHGGRHVISSDPSLTPVPLFETALQKVSDCYDILEIVGEGSKTELTCGVVSFDQVTGQRLVAQLPPMLLLNKLEGNGQRWLSSSLEFIATEAQNLKPGGETIITHLADILVIYLIRHWIEESPHAYEGWVGALRDKQIGIALRSIHQFPERNWTVQQLAKECGMSRSGFSTRFTQLIGNSVKNYLTEWRMNLALQRLKHNSVPLIVLAEESGYGSEAAFSRAFKRVMGFSPRDI